MPPGLAKKKEHNTLNFTREEWQKAKHAGDNPKEIKRKELVVRQNIEDYWDLKPENPAI